LLDLNLRPGFNSEHAIQSALNVANVLKLSEEEAHWLEKHLGGADIAQWCFDEKNMKAIAITRGANGSRLITPEGDLSHPGYPATPGGDPVGAGDAFTSALLYHLLRKTPMDLTLDHANRYASWVASQRGAAPDVPKHLIQQVTA
jgi:fructokinase